MKKILSQPISVFELNQKISALFKKNTDFTNIRVKGEITDLTYARSGHIYFTLLNTSLGEPKPPAKTTGGMWAFNNNSESRIKCAMWASSAAFLEEIPKNGEIYTVVGNVDIYEKSGIYQLIVKRFEKREEALETLPSAELNLKILKEKLFLEGVFEKKRSIPVFPIKIAIVTSKSGAALQDIISIFKSKNNLAHLFIFDTSVQGDKAEKQIVSAINAADAFSPDLIIVARGGGSSEDLSVWNSEEIARAIYKCNAVVISAVGHEIDFLIADYAADIRAATPTAAAVMAAFDIKSVLNNLNREKEIIYEILFNKINKIKNLLQDFLISSETTISLKLLSAKQKLQNQTEIIEIASPLNILKRGFSVVEKNGKIIREKESVAVGDIIKITLASGVVNAEVKNIE